MARRDRLVRQMFRTRYLLTLDTGESFDGLLLDADESYLVIGDAESIAANGDRLKVDGSLWIPRARLVYMQSSRLGVMS